MKKTDLIAQREDLGRHYETLTTYDQQAPVFQKLILMNDKIKHFPTIKLVNTDGETLAVFAAGIDAYAYLLREHPKALKNAQARYEAEVGPTGFRKGFIENWNTYSDHSLELRPLPEDVPEPLVHMAFDYYGCI